MPCIGILEVVATIIINYYFFVLACLDAFLVSELCLSPLLFLQIKISVEQFVVGLEFAVANFLIVQVKKNNNCRANNFKGKVQEFTIYVCHPHRFQSAKLSGPYHAPP